MSSIEKYTCNSNQFVCENDCRQNKSELQDISQINVSSESSFKRFRKIIKIFYLFFFIKLSFLSLCWNIYDHYIPRKNAFKEYDWK